MHLLTSRRVGQGLLALMLLTPIEASAKPYLADSMCADSEGNDLTQLRSAANMVLGTR